MALRADGDAVDKVERAQQAVAGIQTWYHTIDLAEGVATPGIVDLRPVAPLVLPERLDGKRALDVGTFDGFWAFEMERRGAQVVAVDVEKIDDAEWPPNNRARLSEEVKAWGLTLGEGFKVAHTALGSSVDRRICPVYELSPDRIGGPVDLAFLGALQLHLRDPVRALERIFDTIRPGGELIMYEPFKMLDTILHPRRPVAEFQPLATPFNWWFPNLTALRSLPTVAGFTDVRVGKVRYIKGTLKMRQWCATIVAKRP